MNLGIAKLALLAGVLAATAGAAASPLGLRYRAPADDSAAGWERQSLPVGCGHFGANVFGRVDDERIQVTHNALHRPDPAVAAKVALTDALEIRLKTGHANAVDYARGLDLDRAVAWTEYAAGGVRYRREVFASYPDKVLVMRLTADRKGALAFTLAPSAPFLSPFGTDKFGRPCGRRAETRASGDSIEVYQELNALNIRCAAVFKVLTDGRVAPEGETLAVADAGEATVLMAIETNYRLAPEVFAEKDWQKKLRPTDPRPAARATLAAGSGKGYAALLKRHVDDYRALFGRVCIDLGGAAADADVPTDELLARYRRGERSAWLEAAYVQYGRYLLIASSRPGALPANLQGVWNCHDAAPWGAGYWHNINVQMNYWPAFSGNLAECFEPYADFNEAARRSKSDTCYRFVREHTPENLPGRDEPMPDWWILGTANYPYLALGGPGGHDGPGIGGLTTRLFADWWEFTRDETVLRRRAFPAVHGMANFLVRTVRDFGGKRLAAFSASPEQVVAGKRESWTDPVVGMPYYHTVGCAFDQQMLWQNARDLVSMAEALGTNDWVIARCREQLGRYDPVQIGASGQIKEYREENAYGEIGERQHRHISHLVGLMPGTLINRTTPEWMEAAKRTLELRGDHSTGWALAHRLNAWARTGDGEHAYRLYANLLGERTNDNLWDMHPPFQIDGNFGGTAGVIEMLLQSHEGFVELLPALPPGWAKKGSFRGLRARGAFEVDCTWTNGAPSRVCIRSLKGRVPDVRFRGRPLDGGLAAALRVLSESSADFTRCEIGADGVATVEFSLHPEPESDIRCRIVVPRKAKWNGELWGQGNSSLGGFLFDLGRFTREGSAAMTTDLGTARHVNGHSAGSDWPEAVFRDYAWRATHLMTVVGKRFVEAYYGRKPAATLFFGGSCGGRQAHSEAMRFPEDYDGIFSYTPAAIATVSSAQAFNVYRRTHDERGNELFTPDLFRLLADAAVEYMKDLDAKPFAGHVLSNPFWAERDIDGLLDLVARKDARLGESGLRARLKGIYMGDVDSSGRRTCHGMLPGVMLGNPSGMSFRASKLCSCNYRVKDADGKVWIRNANVFSKSPSWDEFEEKAVRHCAEINASATDLTPFLRRGGKFLVSCGLEDQTTPAPETVSWYELLAANHGGIGKTKEFCRLFLLPGVAHGGGEGRIAVAGAEDVHRDLLRKWVLKGVPPETYPLAWPKRGLTIPVPPYPERCVMDEAGAWKRIRYPENMVRHPDPAYLRTATATPES